MTFDDLPFDGDPGPVNLGAPEPRTAHRHRWGTVTLEPGQAIVACLRCGRPKDEAKSRAGRNSRGRGNARERELAKALGGQRTGQFGDATDVRVTGMFAIQSKVRRAFPYWMTAELDKLPRVGGLTPLLIITDSPGIGHKRRSVVVVDLSDWIALHGTDGVKAEP